MALGVLADNPDPTIPPCEYNPLAGVSTRRQKTPSKRLRKRFD
jgi:hypothetical protein